MATPEAGPGSDEILGTHSLFNQVSRRLSLCVPVMSPLTFTPVLLQSVV